MDPFLLTLMISVLVVSEGVLAAFPLLRFNLLVVFGLQPILVGASIMMVSRFPDAYLTGLLFGEGSRVTLGDGLILDFDLMKWAIHSIAILITVYFFLGGGDKWKRRLKKGKELIEQLLEKVRSFEPPVLVPQPVPVRIR